MSFLEKTDSDPILINDLAIHKRYQGWGRRSNKTLNKECTRIERRELDIYVDRLAPTASIGHKGSLRGSLGHGLDGFAHKVFD